MALAIVGTSALNTLVNQGISRLIDPLFSYRESVERTLETFLRIFSHELDHKIETVFRLTFIDQNLHAIKSKTFSAATAIRAWQHSQKEDRAQLDIATSKALSARSLLFQEINRLTETNVDYRPQADSEEKRWKKFMSFNGIINCSRLEDGSYEGNAPFEGVKKAVSHMNHLEAAMKSLEAISTLDLIILVERIRLYPGLVAEGLERVDEYLQKAKQIKEAYLAASVFSAAVRHMDPVFCTTVVYVETKIVEQLFGFDRSLSPLLADYKLSYRSLSGKILSWESKRTIAPQNMLQAQQQANILGIFSLPSPEKIVSGPHPFKSYSNPEAQIDAFARFRCIREEQQDKARQKLASQNHLDALIHTLTELRYDFVSSEEITSSSSSTV